MWLNGEGHTSSEWENWARWALVLVYCLRTATPGGQCETSRARPRVLPHPGMQIQSVRDTIFEDGGEGERT